MVLVTGGSLRLRLGGWPRFLPTQARTVTAPLPVIRTGKPWLQMWLAMGFRLWLATRCCPGLCDGARLSSASISGVAMVVASIQIQVRNEHGSPFAGFLVVAHISDRKRESARLKRSHLGIELLFPRLS